MKSGECIHDCDEDYHILNRCKTVLCVHVKSLILNFWNVLELKVGSYKKLPPFRTNIVAKNQISIYPKCFLIISTSVVKAFSSISVKLI